MPVLFCPVCDSLLSIEQSSNCYALNCTEPSCAYQWFVNSVISQDHIPHADLRLRLEEDAIFSADDVYSNAATIEETCPKCGNKKAYFIEMQTRSADEPSTIKYSCTQCHHIWIEN
ncbi:unnamed protein product [Hymenolepis diminuta]|uniref:DNA-directed RNA polymerase subunit n=1 Tax=Hymenolepis diminuta TaxID=6216 RepID=A0A0R3SS03_HYMDI|nr:unnamed protein product [Hymenolepis diminuta]VUZ39243.1 unnamed protein product [Hymenolepis diminuta]